MLVLALTSGLAETPLALELTRNQTGRFEKIDFHIQVSNTYQNAFDPDEVDLTLQITTPSGQRLDLPAFWCQEYERGDLTGNSLGREWYYPAGTPEWKARFAPAELGAYEAIARLKDKTGSHSSAPVQFQCLPSTHNGFLRISRRDPRFLEFTEDRPFFPVGQNLAFIGSQQYVTLSKAESIFAILARNGANYLRIWTCCEDWGLALEARKSAWGRSWDWRPPLAPLAGSTDTNQLYLHLSPARPSLPANPSHRVALRPASRYVLAGRVRLEGEATLRLELNNRQFELNHVPRAPDGWSTFHERFETSASENWLNSMVFQLQGKGEAYLDTLSLRQDGTGSELLWEAKLNRPRRGYYNPLDCFLLDEIVAAAEKNGIYLQLCLLTRDLYMSALNDPASADYGQALRDAKKLLRYAVARWGYSTSVAAWEYWNEMNPNLPTDRFYTDAGDYLETTDIYHHLRTTSTWGPSAKDCRLSKLDLADAHFYLRPSDKDRLRDEVDAVLDRTRWLRGQAPQKPCHLGEFGLADEKWRITDEMRRSPELADVHNALWASALSGASGTALPWWWERIDQHQGYSIYQPLSRFIAEVPWNSGRVRVLSATASDPSVKVIGLQAADQAWFWIFHPEGAWAKRLQKQGSLESVQNLAVRVDSLPAATYRVRWWDTRQGQVVREEQIKTDAGTLHLSSPPFAGDIACRIANWPVP